MGRVSYPNTKIWMKWFLEDSKTNFGVRPASWIYHSPRMLVKKTIHTLTWSENYEKMLIACVSPGGARKLVYGV